MSNTQSVVIERPGGYNQLTIVAQNDKPCGPNDVVIRVHGIGINFADCLVRMGLYKSAKDYVGWPITPGFEVSGIVDSVGQNVSNVGVGDRVIAVTRFGGYTTRLVVHSQQVFLCPDDLSLTDAAGMSAVFLTAWYALEELAHVRAGAKVMIHSAAGGVGSALVQIAKMKNCYVVGVVGGSHKVQFAYENGCDYVIDASTQPLWKTCDRLCFHNFDIILDANGAETLKQSYQHLSPSGKLVVYGFHTMLPKGKGSPSYLQLLYTFLKTPWFTPLEMTSSNKSVLAFNLSYLFERLDLLAEGMGFLLNGLKKKSLRPLPTTTVPWTNVKQAHQLLESGRTIGKIVVLA